MYHLSYIRSIETLANLPFSWKSSYWGFQADPRNWKWRPFFSTRRLVFNLLKSFDSFYVKDNNKRLMDFFKVFEASQVVKSHQQIGTTGFESRCLSSLLWILQIFGWWLEVAEQCPHHWRPILLELLFTKRYYSIFMIQKQFWLVSNLPLTNNENLMLQAPSKFWLETLPASSFFVVWVQDSY